MHLYSVVFKLAKDLTHYVNYNKILRKNIEQIIMRDNYYILFYWK